MGPQDQMGPQVLAELLEQQDQLVPQAHKEQLVLLELLEQQDQLVLLVLTEQLDPPVLQVPPALQAFKVLPVQPYKE
jgi:hypothetical protein